MCLDFERKAVTGGVEEREAHSDMYSHSISGSTSTLLLHNLMQNLEA